MVVGTGHDAAPWYIWCTGVVSSFVALDLDAHRAARRIQEFSVEPVCRDLAGHVLSTFGVTCTMAMVSRLFHS